MENNQPIIIKRVKKYASGHHGGSWKIAFADFATAMMAFFLVLWLLSTATPEQKIAIAGYFKDPVGFTESGTPYIIDLGGSPTLAPEKTLNPEVKSQPQPDRVTVDTEQVEGMAEQVEKERLELLLQELQNKVDENPQLQKFKDQILFEITQDGLRIQIMDAENRPMFDSGSARLKPYFEDILLAMADTIKAVPNKISISGHTDAKPYSGTGDFGNWELSANRANAARRALVAGSYPDQQVARVVGYASSALFDRENPFNPVNRRIDIVVLTKKAQKAIEGSQGAEPAPEPAPAPAAQGQGGPGEVPAKPVDPNALPADKEPLPAHELRERLNIFENPAPKPAEPPKQ
ncbi:MULTISPECIES: flagellar motor protein MotB [Pseudomonas]|jgi:chemotaxis protein MotB|uniref:Motility protein MotB n=1 Tax=Pseudomonas arsenicoxydans TaxID=702115 RepID=A0A502HS34_9PSED|nr:MULTISPECIES: flagellar motor protein MotB [Pseudomonas]MBF6042799.1 flagellar motor protein MotB [Pseudomonas mucoides]TPG77587.1 motility protein MotB [Pseudomonas arsenicoxydans]CRL49164.1 Motility protein B [Pseudomonas sp. URMO17WK12:I11]